MHGWGGKYRKRVKLTSLLQAGHYFLMDFHWSVKNRDAQNCLQAQRSFLGYSHQLWPAVRLWHASIFQYHTFSFSRRVTCIHKILFIIFHLAKFQLIMTDYQNPNLVVHPGKVRSGKITWRSPSNIALIKYWGKYGNQLPRNPSISFTLDAAYTETILEYGSKVSDKPGVSVDFMFHREHNLQFSNKIERFLTSLLPIFPFLSQIDLTIFSSNSFPHSAGIASSASAMSALALCLCSLEDELFGTLSDDAEFEQKASYIARLGSGSACRSIFSKAALWGETPDVKASSNLYATGWGHHLHPIFTTFHDDILIISKDEKSVSSTAGHKLMENNPYAETRYMTVDTRLKRLISALKSGDVERFGAIVEQEAFGLHGLMMLSEPPYLLMQPSTVAAIQRLMSWRSSTKIPLYFTLDAGPNLHLLYPDESASKVAAFIRSELLPFCVEGSFIPDRVGNGPRQL